MPNSLTKSLSNISRYSLGTRLVCFTLVVILFMLPKIFYNLVVTGTHFWINMGRTYSFAVLYPAAPLLLYGWAKWVNQENRPLHYYGLGLSKQYFKQGLLGFCIGLIGVIGYFSYFYFNNSVIFNPSFTFSKTQTFTLVSWFAGTFGIVLIEEMFFRGFIFLEAYRSIPNFTFAILFSGVFFGICHFKLSLLIPITVMGLVLAQAKVYFNSKITFGMGLHGAWIFFFWGAGMIHLFTWMPDSHGSMPFNTTLTAILILHSCLLLILQYIKNNKEK